MKENDLLRQIDHRPFPPRRSTWVMRQGWKDLLFLHYKVPYELVRKAVPPELELDHYHNSYWVSISPFKMRHVKLRWLPPIPTTYNFLELNFRTYVTHNEKPGIYFFSLDTSSSLAAIAARMAFLPYFRASMSVKSDGNGFCFTSHRKGSKKVPGDLEVAYSPHPEKFFAEKGSLTYWLVERYCLFQKAFNSKVVSIDIHHLPWELQSADADVSKNSLTESIGLQVDGQQPLIHYSNFQKVLVWPPQLK
ncbi:hypothetical protein C900_01839 [Fulvivirga imtechensis AK7]|uniref:DUF2071 domain-containing protein n=1 Tax=Fulvivirga imtechensis AK7 TaxID=1237149 RepID=L8JY07_9BACT|nr:DUF2071 domain-containing protein [Fulvivirga imtechensis]ELR72097.1 hypothetical protein C900_01839 [Fulvivirga imtechensis AK7]